MTTFRNSGFFFGALLALAIFAFWPPYVSKLPGTFSGYTHFHVATMLVWASLLIVQPILIRTRRLALHRALGQSSYGLFPLILVGFVLLAHSRLQNVADADFPLRSFIFFLQVMAFVLFPLSYALAVYHRRTPALHARFMICTGLTLIDPVIARIVIYRLPPMNMPPEFISYPIINLVFLALIFAERRQPKGRAVFPAMLAVFLIFEVLTFVVTPLPAWGAFARWFAALPIT